MTLADAGSWKEGGGGSLEFFWGLEFGIWSFHLQPDPIPLVSKSESTVTDAWSHPEA